MSDKLSMDPMADAVIEKQNKGRKSIGLDRGERPMSDKLTPKPKGTQGIKCPMCGLFYQHEGGCPLGKLIRLTATNAALVEALEKIAHGGAGALPDDISEFAQAALEKR